MIRKFFRWIYIAKGWKAVGQIPPDIKKCVIIGAPHTSSWDFVMAMGAITYFPQRFRYMAKSELFRSPLKWLFVKTGGIPVDRSKHHNSVEAAIDLFKTNEELYLIVPAEGTRKRVTKWKTGFYYIAAGANVPIVLGFLDFKKKEAGFGYSFIPSGDIKKDYEIINDFYRNKTAKNPELFSLNTEFRIFSPRKND
jgi:1-acyl-sn-glycerol-3-phosphate acyltransferase